MKHHYYVLHSPYPNKTWRGLEKCVSDGEGNPLLFESIEEAKECKQVDPALFIPVKVTMECPNVGAPLIPE